jgi:DNA-directed RNA polymerase specialized sigma24 family protein
MLECCRRDGALARFDARQGTACAAFLRGVAANVAARIERREARRAARCRHLGANVHSVPAAAADDGAGSLRDRVEAARAGLARAGDRGRLVAEVLRLNVDSGLPVRTIARRWGCPAEQVHALRRRAIRMLRRRLQGFASA